MKTQSDKSKIKATEQKRLILIEKILKEHGNEIHGLIESTNILSNNLKTHIEESEALLKEWRDGNLENKKSNEEIHEKINRILTIKVNGSANLEDALKAIYEATKKDRAWFTMKRASDEWISTHPVLEKFYESKFSKWLTGFVVFSFVFVFLQLFGVINVTFYQFISLLSAIASRIPIVRTWF